MTSYVTPKKNSAFIMYVGLPDYANLGRLKSGPTMAAGDFKVSKDGGAFANLTNLPVATGVAVQLSLTSTEMNADNVTIACIDQTSPAEWCDTIVNVQTSARQVDDLAFPATSGRSIVVDAGGLVDANMVKAGPTGAGTAQTTGDIFARIGAPAGASVAADIAAVKVDTAAVKVQTDKLVFTVANQVDVNVIDWKGAAAPAMTGDAFARLGAPAGASISADIAAGFARLGAPAGASIAADIAAVKVDTASISASALTAAGVRAAVGLASANLDTQLAAIAGYIDTEVGTIITNIAALPTANANADALLDRANAIETGWTLRQVMRILASVLGGKLSGAGTATETFRSITDGKDRVTATVDSSGNRTAITTDAT